MNKVADHITGNVLRHALFQLATIAGLAAAGALAKADYSAFGSYAPYCQMAAACACGMLNEFLGTAPKA